MVNNMFDISDNGSLVFSWAENKNGEMVHIDSVANGNACQCHCPACGEPLKARHGDIRSHGFAHLSRDRKANLKSCYQVAIYKLAEQTIKNRKKIFTPSYYGIFGSKEISFTNIQINSEYKRLDKQPDIIATTKDGQIYIIELFFEEKESGHAKEIDFKTKNCFEINLMGQTLDSIEEFISGKPNEQWKWVNNNTYFNSIEETYKNEGKSIALSELEDCNKCEIAHRCISNYCCAKDKDSQVVEIKNDCSTYRICKTEEKKKLLEESKSKSHVNIGQSTNCDNEDYLSNDFAPNNCRICKNEIPHYRKSDGRIYCGKDYQFHFSSEETNCCNFEK